MFGLSLQQVLFRLVAALVAIGAHGFAVAGLARLLGDRGPQHDERMTINPFSHLEALGGLGLLLYQLGWIKPVDIDPAQLRGQRWGLVAVALGALVCTLLVAVLIWRLRRLAFLLSNSPILFALMNDVVDTLVWFAVFNIFPIPPLTGGYLVQAAAPDLYRTISVRWIVPALLLAVLVVTGIAPDFLRPVHDLVRRGLGF